MVKSFPTKPLRGTEVEINGNKYNRTPGLQKVFTERTYQFANSMNDNDKVVFRDILQKTGYYNRKPTKGRLSDRDRSIKTILMMK